MFDDRNLTIKELQKENATLKDKISRRNMQIKDLKEKQQYIKTDTIIDILKYLDGRGIIYTDQDLVRKALKEYKFINR